ncbi:uncharacterized protein ACWYII_006803 isoform 1-T1 [Salvelinus alpinus]
MTSERDFGSELLASSSAHCHTQRRGGAVRIHISVAQAVFTCKTSGLVEGDTGYVGEPVSTRDSMMSNDRERHDQRSLQSLTLGGPKLVYKDKEDKGQALRGIALAIF